MRRSRRIVEHAANAVDVHLRHATIALDAACADLLAARHARDEVGIGDQRTTHGHEVEAFGHRSLDVVARDDAAEQHEGDPDGAANLPGLLETSIGHAQICRALEVGTAQSVRELLAALGHAVSE